MSFIVINALFVFFYFSKVKLCAGPHMSSVTNSLFHHQVIDKYTIVYFLGFNKEVF